MKTLGTISICLVAGILFASNSFSWWKSTQPDLMPVIKLKDGDDLVSMIKDSEKSLLIDFYAEWCGPCRTQSEILAEVAKDLPDDEIRFIKVDVDQHSELAAHFRVSSIPALFVIKNEKVVAKHEGVADAWQLQDWLTW